MEKMNLVVICVDTFRADIIGQNKKLSFVKSVLNLIKDF